MKAVLAPRIEKAPKVLARDLKRYYAGNNVKCRAKIKVQNKLKGEVHIKQK